MYTMDRAATFQFHHHHPIIIVIFIANSQHCHQAKMKCQFSSSVYGSEQHQNVGVIEKMPTSPLKKKFFNVLVVHNLATVFDSDSLLHKTASRANENKPHH